MLVLGRESGSWDEIGMCCVFLVVVVFFVVACSLVRDLGRSGCRHSYH